MHTCIHACMHRCIYTCMHTYMHTYMHAPMYTYTHTNSTHGHTHGHECCRVLYYGGVSWCQSPPGEADNGLSTQFCSFHGCGSAVLAAWKPEPLDVISLDVCFVGNQTVQVCRVFIIWSDQNGIIRIVEWSGLGEMSSYRIEQIRLVCCTQFP